MKHLTKLILIAIFLSHASYAHAVTIAPTVNPTASPTTNETLNSKLNNQINQLKDKIASRVSELNLVEKKGIVGTVSESAANKITLVDVEGNSKQVDVDEITKFSSSSSKSAFGLSDLTKGKKISVIGLYNKQSKRILARFIRFSIDPVFLSGVISEIDGKNFQLDIISSDQKKTKVDIAQFATRISSYTKETKLTKLLFAGLAVGDRIIVVGFPDKTDPALIVASRITTFPELPKDPKISVVAQPTATPTIAPTAVINRRLAPTAAVKLLTPTTAITKPTPTPIK